MRDVTTLVRREIEGTPANLTAEQFNMCIFDETYQEELDSRIILSGISKITLKRSIWDYEDVVDQLGRPLKVGDIVIRSHIGIVQPAIITSIVGIKCALSFSGNISDSKDRCGNYKYDYNIHTLIKITKEELISFYNLFNDANT